jgi:hypothetical protein
VSGDRVGYTMVLSDYVCGHRIRGVGQIDRASVSRLKLRLMFPHVSIVSFVIIVSQGDVL